MSTVFGLFRGFIANANHFFMGLCLLANGAGLMVLVRWYGLGDLDPKFRRFIMAGIATYGLLCVVSNVYFWQDERSVTALLPKGAT